MWNTSNTQIMHSSQVYVLRSWVLYYTTTIFKLNQLKCTNSAAIRLYSLQWSWPHLIWFWLVVGLDAFPLHILSHLSFGSTAPIRVEMHFAPSYHCQLCAYAVHRDEVWKPLFPLSLAEHIRHRSNISVSLSVCSVSVSPTVSSPCFVCKTVAIRSMPHLHMVYRSKFRTQHNNADCTNETSIVYSDINLLNASS